MLLRFDRDHVTLFLHLFFFHRETPDTKTSAFRDVNFEEVKIKCYLLFGLYVFEVQMQKPEQPRHPEDRNCLTDLMGEVSCRKNHSPVSFADCKTGKDI